MTHDIKQLKPKKGGRYRQGYVNPRGCKKLYESQENKPIIYRSSYEYKFIQWLERSSQVVRWGSECIGIRYISPLDGKTHTYYPDYVMELNDGTTVLVEIKPWHETQPPPANVPQNSYQYTTYVKNRAKWQAAIDFCSHNNMKFMIFTEHTIDRL